MSQYTEDLVEVLFPTLIGEGTDGVISQWKSYTLTHKFLEPCATFDMVVGGSAVSDEVLGSLKPGLDIVLRVNGAVQFTGYLDAYETDVSRDGGTELRITGRDMMGPVVDSCADYTIPVKAKDTLAKVVAAFLEPFNFGEIKLDNSTNVEIVQGRMSGRHIKAPVDTPRRRRRTRHRKKTSGWETSLLVPYPGEGTYEFLQRLLTREGLYLWCAADTTEDGGGIAVVSCPDVFSMVDEDYNLTLKKDGTGNVLSATCRRDWKDQPSIVFVSGANRHEGFARGRHKVFIANPFASTDPNDNTTAFAQEIQRLKKKHGDGRELIVQLQQKQEKYLTLNPVARPTFLTAPEGNTPTQVEFFARRYLADKMRKHFTYNCTVRGHTAPNGGVWAVDTCVNVVDEYNNVNERLYILGKTFMRSRANGTITKLELIRPESLEWLGNEAYSNLSEEAFILEAKEEAAVKAQLALAAEEKRRQAEADALQRDITGSIPVEIDSPPKIDVERQLAYNRLHGVRKAKFTRGG